MTRHSSTFAALSLLVASACGGDGGDDGAGTTGESTYTTAYTQGDADPSAVSQSLTGDPSDPSEDPSEDPTNDPSEDPTNDPTEDPTNDPTEDPTDDPTEDPTSDPDTGSTGTESSGAASSESSAGESDTGSPGGACCEAQDEAGCGDATIESCVCDSESFCCDVQWDLYCTVLVVTLGCDVCPGIGGDGDCCAAHDNPGCDDAKVEACVCEDDLTCCTEVWDDLCAEQATDCGGC